MLLIISILHYWHPNGLIELNQTSFVMRTIVPSSENENVTHSLRLMTRFTGDIRVQSLEWMRQNHRDQTGVPERTTYFELIWVKKGNGYLTIDLKRLSISENTIYCLAPGQYRALDLLDPVQGYYIFLSAEFLHLSECPVDFSLLISQFKRAGTFPAVIPDLEMEELMIRIQKEYNNQGRLRSEILKGLLKLFLIYLSRQTEQVSERFKAVRHEKDADVVSKFMALLGKHFATKKLVADYADELCITPNYLNSIVKKQTGFPVSHHIQQHIIMEAKRQAMYSGLRMKEVADRLGFEDYAHFSKFFKNYSGMNFSSFKKEFVMQ